MLGNTLTTITTTDADNTQGFDIDVKSEVGTHDELVVLLLTVVEQITGVSTDNYVAEVDSHRARAGF
jgi:hypothetical protein